MWKCLLRENTKMRKHENACCNVLQGHCNRQAIFDFSYLSRWWQRKGFGVQSPSDYAYLRQVLAAGPRSEVCQRIAASPLTGEATIVHDTSSPKWQQLLQAPHTITFDMGDLGLALHRPGRYSEHYRI